MYDQSTFPGLLTGPSNRFALSACEAVAACPGQCYNPLWVCGPSGTGKTTLLRSVTKQLRGNFPRLQILRIQAEEFIQNLLHAIRTDTSAHFHQRLCMQDVIVIDGLEILLGKPTTQTRLAEILAEQANRGCQIILASTCPTPALQELLLELRTRCEWFLPLDILTPTDEERLTMVRQTASELDLPLPGEILRRIVRDTCTHSQIHSVLLHLATRQKLLGADAVDPSRVLDTLLSKAVSP